MIRLLIADDHAIVREGLRKILSQTSDITVEAEAASGHEVLDQLRRTEFDALCLDLSMPSPSGIELVKRIRGEYPKLPILVLSMHSEGLFAARALKAGASGYLTKDQGSDMLVGAIRKIAAGRRFIDPELVDELVFDNVLSDELQPHERLSDREFEILVMIARGDALTDIADRLFLSAKTISTYKTRAMQKLGLANHTELVRYAIDHQLI